MQNVGSDGFGVHSEDHRIDCLNNGKEKEVMGDLHQENIGDAQNSSQGYSEGKDDSTVLNIVICNGDPLNQAPETSEPKGSGSVISNGEPCNEVPLASEQNGESYGSTTVSQELNLNALRITGTNKDEVSVAVMSPKKVSLSRSDSSHEDCRVCQQQSEEPLIDLGCRCRGGLARAHLSCINTWFSTRGSNKCEICQEVAVNVPPPESHPSVSVLTEDKTCIIRLRLVCCRHCFSSVIWAKFSGYQRNYWIWRINPSGGIARQQSRGCYSPLWVALSILIGGLLLDVLISISLGVSALPVNIIIGVLVVLGLGTAFRLALECCQEISMRRAIHRVDANVNPDFHPSIWQNL